MAVRLIWSLEALEDTESIASYIERDSPAYAVTIVKALFAAAVELRRFPRMGRMVPEVNQETLRERIVHNYRLIYLTSKDSVVIVAVIHGRQLLGPGSENILRPE